MQPNMTSDELADYLIITYDREEIINKLFSYFDFDCQKRIFVNPAEFDRKISRFRETGAKNREILASLIDDIYNGIEKQTESCANIITDTKNYIAKHLSDDLRVEKIAAELNISYYYLSHLFKQKTGISISRYRIRKRMEKAVYLLMHGDFRSVSDIAMLCGYNNISYFTENFTEEFEMPPKKFKEENSSAVFQPEYTVDDINFLKSIPFIKMSSSKMKPCHADLKITVVQPADKDYQFLHESALIKYHGILFASWYFCPEKELMGHTPICGRRSYDNGKTWTDIEFIAVDPTDKVLYCPPIYGICDDKLYMFVNEMVSADHIHSLDLYVLDEKTDRFVKLWSRPIPFKINTNVVALPNGRLMIPGRIGALDGFPNTPAVMISDSGKIDAEWRVVNVAENGDLPLGRQLVFPETTAVRFGEKLYLFCRDDQFRIPLVYLSDDMGESWSELHAHDIPCITSKIYGGNLSDGRKYIVFNEATEDFYARTRLVLYITGKDSDLFEERLILMDCTKDRTYPACHYPCAYEESGKLYIIATIDYNEESTRGAALFTVDLNSEK